MVSRWSVRRLIRWNGDCRSAAWPEMARMTAAEWVASTVDHRRPRLVELLGLASGHSVRIAKMQRLVDTLEREAEESGGCAGVSFGAIRGVHGVLFPPDTMECLVSAVRHGLNNFARMLPGTIAMVRPTRRDHEQECRLQVFVTCAGRSIWNALDAGSVDTMLERAVQAVDGVWATHAVPAIQTERARFALQLRLLRNLLDAPAKSPEKVAHALRAAEVMAKGTDIQLGESRADLRAAITRVEKKLAEGVDSCCWHGIRIGPEGVPLVGPSAHAPLVADGKAHVAPAEVEMELFLPVVQAAYAIRALVYKGYLRLDVLSSEVVKRMAVDDLDRFTRTHMRLQAELNTYRGFDPYFTISDAAPPLPAFASPPRQASSPPPTSEVRTHDPIFRQVDLESRVSAADVPFDRALAGLKLVPMDLEVDYAVTATVLVAASGHPRCLTKIELLSKVLLPRVRVLLKKHAREFLEASLTQKIGAVLKRLAALEIEGVEIEFVTGRQCGIRFSGLHSVRLSCLALSTLLRQMEQGGEEVPWRRVVRYRKRDRRS